MEAAKTFNKRAFAAVAATVSGLGLPITGYMNHVLQFEGMSVARHAWMAAHNCLAILFVIFTVWHAAINRRALFNYLKGWRFILSREAVAATLLVALASLAIILHAFHAG